MRLTESQLKQVYEWCRVPSNRALIKDFCRYKATRYILCQVLSIPLDHPSVKQQANFLSSHFCRCERQYAEMAQLRNTLKSTEPDITEQQTEGKIKREKWNKHG